MNLPAIWQFEGFALEKRETPDEIRSADIFSARWPVKSRGIVKEANRQGLEC
jgi:hypothetical protein